MYINNSNRGKRLKTSKPNNDNHAKIYKYFSSKGLKSHQIAGIMGNLAAESYYDIIPSTENNIGAYGIAQWLGSRKKDLYKFAENKDLNVSDLNTQLDFMWHELNTTERRALKKLRNAKSIEDATNVFVNYYERPSKPEIEESIDRRYKYAKGFLDTFGTDVTIPETSTPIDSRDGNVNEYSPTVKDSIENSSSHLNRIQIDLDKYSYNSNKVNSKFKNDSIKQYLISENNKSNNIKKLISDLNLKFEPLHSSSN